MSHPTWVRGLKQALGVEAVAGNYVAPYVGAWIETVWKYAKNIVNGSHPTWVRGLKRFCCGNRDMYAQSHPTWVRGLKQVVQCLNI